MINLLKIRCGVSQQLHPYLQQALKQNGLLPLRPCQQTVALV